MKKILLAIPLLLLVGCGINPMEGEYGLFAVVPEEKTCMDKVRHEDGRVNYQARKCDGADHDVRFLGRRW